MKRDERRGGLNFAIQLLMTVDPRENHPDCPARPSPAACLITLNFGGGDRVGMEIGFAQHNPRIRGLGNIFKLARVGVRRMNEKW